jgi:hypothetical protein
MRSLLAIVLVAACGSETMDVGVDAAPPDVAADAYFDLSGPVFQPDHIVEVAITLPVADWDVLRGQTRDFSTVIEGNCLAQPQPSPFTKFSATIVVDGTRLDQVGIKKKGFFGSLDPNKPSLKITFDEFVPGQEYLGLEKLTLNNSHQDPAYVRQCVAYQAFGAAGIVVPRCNFAHVRVNGTDLGVYVNVESIDHHMMKKRYADGRGNLYEGTLSDFRPAWLGTFDAKGGGTGDDLVGIANAAENATDANLVSELSQFTDVDRFYTYWAMEVITNHWDGYANDKNNFFVYHDPTTDKLDFIPWGPDGAFQKDSTFGGIGSTTGPIAVAANGVLAHRLFSMADTKATFIARQRSLLATVWNEGAMLAEIDRMEALITPIADAVDGTGWHTAVTGVRQFVNGRRAKLTAALDAGPTWPDPLQGYPCLDVVATIEGTFSTTWGTMAATDPFATGSGTMALTMGGTTTTLTPIGAKSGLDPNPAPNTQAQAVVQVFGVRASDNHIIALSMALPPQYFFPRTGMLGFFDGFALVFDYNPSTDTSTVIGFVLGSFSLSQASMTSGQPVVGTFSGHVDMQGTPP